MVATSSKSPTWRLTSRIALPILAAGLLGLAPWQAVGLFQRWQAMAQNAPTTAKEAPAAGDPSTRRADAATPIQGPAAIPPGSAYDPAAQRPADGTLLVELNQRAAELDRREHDLKTWATQIAAAERLARAELTELGQMRADLEKTVAAQSVASDEDLAVLVGLYSNMKPSQAAVLLGRLDAPKAAAILEKLDIHSAGPALAAMDPTMAVAITEELSRRHAPFRK